MNQQEQQHHNSNEKKRTKREANKTPNPQVTQNTIAQYLLIVEQ